MSAVKIEDFSTPRASSLEIKGKKETPFLDYAYLEGMLRSE